MTDEVLLESWEGTGVSGYGYTYGVNWKCQTFMHETTHQITKIVIPLIKVGNPAGDYTIQIRNCVLRNSYWRPEGSTLCSKSILASDVSGSVSFVFATPATLNGNQVYGIVDSCVDGDSENYIGWYSYNAGSYRDTLCNKGASSDSGVTFGLYTTTDYRFEVWGYELPTHHKKHVPFKEPTRLERCIRNIMDARGLTEKEARDICVNDFHLDFEGDTQGNIRRAKTERHERLRQQKMDEEKIQLQKEQDEINRITKNLDSGLYKKMFAERRQ